MSKNSFLPLVLLLAFAMSACSFSKYAGFPGEKTYLPKRNELSSFVYGHWVQVKQDNSNPADTLIQGELIAIDESTVHILSAGNVYRPVAKPEITSAKLWLHISEAQRAKVHSSAMLATIPTHGWFMLITGPMWAVTSAATTSAMKRERPHFLELKDNNWNELAAYARFPMGMPPAIDLNKLSLKETPSASSD